MADRDTIKRWGDDNFGKLSAKEVYKAAARATREGYDSLAKYLKAVADLKYGTDKANDLMAIKAAASAVEASQEAAYHQGSQEVLRSVLTSSKDRQ